MTHPDTNTEAPRRQIAEILQKALELFGSDGEFWMDRCPPFGYHCMVTALSTAASEDYDARKHARLALIDAAGIKFPEHLSHWNDSHTWPEVKAAFEKAVQRCQDSEGGAT